MALILPQLPGVTWPVDLEAGQFDTTVETSVSGKLATYINRTQPRYTRTLKFDVLDSSGDYPGALTNSMRTLKAFFNACYGRALMFQFWAPEDNYATSQQFGVGDGATTTFLLARADGGAVDNVFAPLAPSGPALIPSPSNPNGATVYAPNNLANWSSNLANAAWTKTNVTVASGVSDPLGGTAAFTLTATSASGFIVQTMGGISGANAITSIWARRRTGTGTVYLNAPSASPQVALALTSSWQRFSVAGAPSGSFNAFICMLITSGDAIDVYGPQWEASTVSTPGTYFATAASDYYGGPYITANGALVDPSLYTVNTVGGSVNGTITFATAPAAGVALNWTGNFYWWANFDDDKLSLSQVMNGLWEAGKVSFTTRVF